MFIHFWLLLVHKEFKKHQGKDMLYIHWNSTSELYVLNFNVDFFWEKCYGTHACTQFKISTYEKSREHFRKSILQIELLLVCSKVTFIIDFHILCRQHLDETLQMLRESNARFIKSFKWVKWIIRNVCLFVYLSIFYLF